jgi:hypothetical protein
MAIKQLKTLTLTMDDTEVQCQLTTAQLVDNPDTEELSTFCGTETSAIANYDLEISGFQDYGTAESVFDMLHESYRSYQTDATADAPIDVVLTVGSQTRSFTAKPVNDPPFGGDAGAALTADVTLDVISDVVDGVATP